MQPPVEGRPQVHQSSEDADLHPATRQIIAELRRKTRHQCEHIMQLQRALCSQQQQHRCELGLKADQLAALANQLMLLESRLKRRQQQIANCLRQREQTIVRQQRVIETLSTRLTDHGLGVSVLPDRTSCESAFTGAANANDLDSLNDSDSAVVLDDIDLDWASIASGGGGVNGCLRRDSNGSAPNSTSHPSGLNGDGVTIVRSISDAIDTNYKAAYGKRGSCFLRRPEVLETVYSVEEDHEAPDGCAANTSAAHAGPNKMASSTNSSFSSSTSSTTAAAKRANMAANGTSSCGHRYPPHRNSLSDRLDDSADCVSIASASASLQQLGSASSLSSSPDRSTVRTTTHYNRVMSSNHRSVTKPKDVKYRRINKVKSKSLEELCGQLKQTSSNGAGVGGSSGEMAEVHQQQQQQQQQQQLRQSLLMQHNQQYQRPLAATGQKQRAATNGGTHT